MNKRVRLLLPVAGTALTVVSQLSVGAGWFKNVPAAVLALLWVVAGGLWLWWLLTDKRVIRWLRTPLRASGRRGAQLEIVFGGDVKPYLEEQRVNPMPDQVFVDRRYRVGIRNSGDATVSRLRLVLENCEPSSSDGVHLSHAMQVMGAPRGNSEFSVRPASAASVFIDVIYDEILDGHLYGDAFGLCYAAEVRRAIPRGSYVLTLRLEGPGARCRKSFRIGQDPASGMLLMRELEK